MGRLRTSELLAALSVALDLTEGQRAGHALHTAYLALRLADRIGLPRETRRAVLYTALLKDAGCSSNAAEVTRIFGIDDQELKAMTAERPYRPAMTEEHALAIMRKSSGDHLAAEVIAGLSDVDSRAA